ncbi:MAG: hypothetical protein ACI8QZ_000275 [Chlamydiales bacterium]|jgi:hypothetical protein
MRRVLVLAALLLALVGLRAWGLRGAVERTDGQVVHRLLSTGWGLPGGLRARPEGLGAIWIGRQWFVPEDGADGLRVAATTLTGDVLDFFNYDLTAPADARRFARHCETRDVGTVLSLVLRGSMCNSDPGLRDLIAATCAGLGARAAPVDLETASWALVVRRTRDGWRCLGEAFSPARGVVLTVPLVAREAPIDLIEREGPRVVSWIARRFGESGRDRIRTAWPLVHGTCDGLRWGFGGRNRPALPDMSAPFELALEMGARPRFECMLVVPPSVRTGRAEFVLRVDGAVVARQTLAAGASTQVSEPWRVDLVEHAGRDVILDLSVEAEGLPWAAAATPVLSFD